MQGKGNRKGQKNLSRGRKVTKQNDIFLVCSSIFLLFNNLLILEIIPRQNFVLTASYWSVSK